MILKLTGEQVSQFWEIISYSWLQTNPAPPGVSVTSYLNVLLDNLLSGAAQAWIVYTESEAAGKNIIAVAVTRTLREQLSGVSTVWIQSLYGLRKLSNETAREAFESFLVYARNTGAQQVKLQTSIPRVAELAKLCGSTRTAEIFTYNL